MSETMGSKGAISRRGFVKAACATGAALGLSGLGSMASANDWLAPASAVAEPSEKQVYTLHQFMCQGNCSLKCTVRDGRLCMIQPNDTVDGYYQHVCLKGISEIQHVYSNDRLQTPMKRVGERGENKFEAISWDEALQIVGDELKAAWKKYGHESVYVSASNEPRFGMMAPLLKAGTGCEPGIDRGVGQGIDAAKGGSGFADGTNETRDWVNSKIVIIAGNNALEASMMQAGAFFDAQDAGCEIVYIDPHFSTTAGKADQWLPIKPGTDGAFFLGMLSYVIDNKLYDKAYMREHTTLPLLVDAKTGKLLRSGKGDAPYMVWDQKKGAAVPHDQAGRNTALEGEFTVDGKRYTTTFELLKKNQRPYTTKWAAEKTSIAQEKIEEIARKYAEGPGCIGFGMGGSDKFSNPDIQGHAIVTLAALTGNVGKPGAGFGNYNGGMGRGAALASWPLPEEFVSPTLPVRADRFPVQENDVHVIISLGNTFQQYFANYNQTREWIKSLDFILHVGMYYEDTVAFADVVLPVCSKFEDTVEHSIVRSGYNHVILQQKCIDPLFESKPDFDVMQLILKSVGLDGYLPKDAEELTRYMVDQSEDLRAQGITFDKLVKNHGSMPVAGIEVPRVGFEDQAFPTPTGKLEVYYESQVPVSQGWPTWEENNEVFDENPLLEKYPLQFTQTRTRFSNHSHMKAATWLQQLHGSYLELNPEDMQKRGLKDGDVIEGFNDRGSFKCPVHANAAVRPGSARTFEAGWSKHMVEGNTQNVTNDHINPRDAYLMTGAPIPFNDTLIEVKKA
ncbi:MAG: molybdopterin-dependent oxidoreductase [Coriobacteriia bacterium]|nr:molybdopterin-dependent oxidoreductase [Coriobacteriia bacterium]